ncbi:phosphatase PAP2 family protein [Dawidia soli]|uniref:Phosphatase PAP2 family protein n=1 Tax=Dawidia soli TaxID=2782352 RepID=A0AAP2D6A7_9BACT|nr:phosphatase PAP2 family protein [Dawidia soli]MBT1686176.1 phosphatase PAP2 family protein [Dawidia soli]
MKKISLFVLFLAAGVLAVAQKKSHQPLEPVSDHYKELQAFSAAVNPARAWMDTIKYPPAEYSSAIVYLLVKPYYLTDAQVKTLRESVKFPANSSDQVRKELDYMLDLQAKRTSEQEKRVRFLGDIGYWPWINLVPSHPSYEENLANLFFEGSELMGNEVNARNLPKVAKLLQGVMQDMRVMEFTIKYTLFRPRPYHLEPKLAPLTKINSPSFASGHTLWAFVQAFTWSEVVPEKRKNFIALAEEIRRSREIMGIHYPSDNEASRQLSYKMVQYYLQNPVFQKDLREAVAEWNAVSPKLVRR